jgi:carboxypeptidase PM20D1
MPPFLFAALFALLVLGPATEALASPAERLAEAVRLRTISYQDSDRVDYSQFERFHELLQRSYPRVYDELLVERVNGYSLLVRWPGSDPAAAPILFTAHSDVVPIEPGTEGDWQHPPFGGVVADGRIYGRGTLDDKQGVLGLMEAAESLLAEGFQPRRSIVLAFGHDEEIGGREGAAQLAQRMRELDLHFEWMVDEGGMILEDTPMLPGRPMAMINIAEKAYLTLTLTVMGEGGHSSNPPQVSTIGRLSNALAKIEANPFPPRLEAPVVAMLESLAPHLGQPERFIFNNLWLTGPLVASRMTEDRLTMPFVRTTTALTMVNAGIKENVVPQIAEAKVNFRLLPGDTPQMVIDRIREIVDDPTIDISHDRWDNLPGVADHTGGGFAVLSEAVRSVYSDVVVSPSLLIATTDTRHYVDLADHQYRFHAVMMASSQAASIHGTNEYVGVDSYEKSIEAARQMMKLGAR